MAWSGRWSPVLLPSPGSVVDYLQSAVADGSLPEATLVTLRRLLIGYAIGVAIGLPLGLLSSAFRFVEDTMGVMALGLQTLAERLLGAARAAVVRPDRERACCSWS